MKPFPGFPAKTSATPLPDAFFSLLLPHIDDLAELKVTLYIVWLLSRRQEGPRFVSLGELMINKVLMSGLGGREELSQALERACGRGSLLPLTMSRNGKEYHLYFLNTPEDKQAREQMANDGRVTALAGEETPATDIFTLYEEAFGQLLTPMIAEELKRAELLYPPSWIEAAFKEAVDLNKLSWRYVTRILERWARDGKTGRDPKEKTDREKYIKGRFEHLLHP
ncbi:MAG: DnaD domain protein [Chloroflexota bacterium]